MSVPRDECVILGRIGAFTQQSRHDPRKTTAAARAAFLAGFERAVDPDGSLDPEERSRRARAAKRAYFQRLALLSVRARRAKAGGQQ